MFFDDQKQPVRRIKQTILPAFLVIFIFLLPQVLWGAVGPSSEVSTQTTSKLKTSSSLGGGSGGLSQFGQDITALAQEGHGDPIIGRNEEIRRTIEVLSQKNKSNPILVGEPGVGKTAIIEGLAQRIARDEVPADLKNKRIFSLDMGSLVAGAGVQGEFEARLKAVIEEVSKSRGQIILFIDEIHTIMGAGNSQGGMGAAQLLKPMLARGELKVIGATTIDEYREHLEKDPALERRFQRVVIEEPSGALAKDILRGLRPGLEAAHNLKITDEAIKAAVELSQRYITDRQLPDKAIELVDKAAAKLKTDVSAAPVTLEGQQQKLLSLKREKNKFGPRK